MQSLAAAARAKLALHELQVLEPTIAAHVPDIPEPCLVLALPSREPDEVKVPRTAASAAKRSMARVKYWQWALAALFLLLAFPNTAAAPAYAFGWGVRLLAARIKAVVQTFIDTFYQVTGDLLTDAAKATASVFAPMDDVNLGGIFFTMCAYFTLRRAHF